MYCSDRALGDFMVLLIKGNLDFVLDFVVSVWRSMERLRVSSRACSGAEPWMPHCNLVKPCCVNCSPAPADLILAEFPWSNPVSCLTLL